MNTTVLKQAVWFLSMVCHGALNQAMVAYRAFLINIHTELKVNAIYFYTLSNFLKTPQSIRLLTLAEVPYLSVKNGYL